jgi:succinate dehydrogenase / fumarate reductase cytochrome b subunit
MSWIFDIYRSAMAKKVVMAVTGLILFGFVLGHMAGNLKLYLGQYQQGEHQGEYQIDVYAEGLREIGAPILRHGDALWIARIGLLAAVLLHIVSAYQLTMINWRARPEGYARSMVPQASTYASRTMRYGGVIILLFVVYHLLHLTVGSVHPDFEPGEVYRNVVIGFSQPLVSAFYVLAQIALGLHLYHGLWSLFQSIGWSGERFDRFRRQFSAVFAIVITLGNISFPVAVLTGLVGLPS